MEAEPDESLEEQRGFAEVQKRCKAESSPWVRSSC